ncbi:MAG: winged helix-turn-helix transcriptional regulator [Syntrophaceae bacterium]|nr:winged helix-turn-helix transcriptional regulator [Syntrophaceae bacterium]
MEQKESIGRMLGYLYRNSQKYFHKEFSKLDLGGGTHFFLKFLYHHDGVTQNELSTRLNFNKAHTARAIQKLIDIGYITKEKDEKDHRAFRIHLTHKAKKIESEIQKVLDSWSNIITNGFTQDEKKRMMELLKKMTDNIDDYMNTSVTA